MVASIRPIRPPVPEPVELQATAMDNLLYIRRTMERAGSFTAVPGAGGVLMGATALAAAWMAGEPGGCAAVAGGLGGRSGVGAAHRDGGGSAEVGAREDAAAFGAGAQVHRSVCAVDGGGRAADLGAVPGWSASRSAGRLAAAVRRRRGLGRRGVGEDRAADGRVLYGGGRVGVAGCRLPGETRCWRRGLAGCTFCSGWPFR